MAWTRGPNGTFLAERRTSHFSGVLYNTSDFQEFSCLPSAFVRDPVSFPVRRNWLWFLIRIVISEAGGYAGGSLLEVIFPEHVVKIPPYLCAMRTCAP